MCNASIYSNSNMKPLDMILQGNFAQTFSYVVPDKAIMCLKEHILIYMYVCMYVSI